MSAPCAGLRVLDLSRGPAAGIATMVLGDFGAEVIKIEPPGGDPFQDLAASPVWLRGKQRIAVNLKTGEGVERLHDLAADADILVASYRPGVAQRLQADFETLSTINPGLVYCSVTGWGPSGPYSGYRGYEGLVAAKSGRMMSFAGQIPRAGPVYAAVQVGIHAAAQAAVQGILAALLVRAESGRGQLVETSLLQGMLPYDLAGLFIQQLMRTLPDQYPIDPLAAITRLPTLQYQPVLTADGRWLQLGNLVEHLFHAFIVAADLSWIYGDPRFEGAPYLADEPREALRDVILERMQERTLAEWMECFIADGNVASEPIVSTQDALQHPQALHNRNVVQVDYARLGRVKQIGLLAYLPQTPGVVAGCRPPTNDPVRFSETTAESIQTRRRTSSREGQRGERRVRHPLEGVTVVEFASIIATPLACSLLGDLGARVIKVEPPEGDGYRNLGNGVGVAKTTASKESICLDLKAEAGRKIAHQLLERADVLVHNYRPGVPERLGIGYEQVRAFNPEIVYVSATGYGSDGPYAHRPSAHPIAGALAGGVLWQAGSTMPPTHVEGLEAIRECARRLYRANEVNPDPNSSMVIATAAMLGLYVRKTQGIGQHVQTNMLISNAYANLDDFLAYDGKPERQLVDPALHGLHALYRLYPAAEGWVFLACPFEEEWQRLCLALNRAELLADPRFRTAAARRAHDADLVGLLGGIFSERTADAWEEYLTDRDLGCVRADRDTPGSFWDRDEHVYQNGFVREAEHLRWGPYWRHGPLVSLSETPGRYGAGVLGGQHTRQLLRELGYSGEEITALIAAGTVRTAEP
ncbi:MAG: CaiB/BaiF CoA transferase family protein [Dehalococcoidia bacterium]